VRCLVAALRTRGDDPLPHLLAVASPSTPAPPITTPPTATAKHASSLAPVAGSSGPTIATFFPDWIATTEGSVRPALTRDRRRHFATYIAPDPIADLSLASLRPMDVQLFQGRLRQRVSTRTGRPLSEKTVVCVIGSTLRALVRDATVQDLVLRDPFVGLTWKTWKIPPADPFTPEEWDRIATWFAGRTFQRKLVWRQHPAFHGYVFFLRWHGARPSEAAALTWDNIDLRQGIAYIEASYHYRAVCDPKTRAARRSIELHPEMLTLFRELRPLRPAPGQIVFPNMDGRHIRNATFWDIWTRCLQDCRIRHRGIYALKDTFVTHTLIAAEETGEVERLTAWLVRQTGVRLDTLKQHYARWWPRDPAAIRATYALLDPAVSGQIVTRSGSQSRQVPDYTAKRKWTMSPSCTT
jgi:integrase